MNSGQICWFRLQAPVNWFRPLVDVQSSTIIIGIVDQIILGAVGLGFKIEIEIYFTYCIKQWKLSCFSCRAYFFSSYVAFSVMLNRIRGSLFIGMSHFQAQMIIHSFSWFLQIPIYMFKLLSRQNVRRETIKIFITTLCCLKWFTFVLPLYDLSIQHLNKISLASSAKFFIYMS